MLGLCSFVNGKYDQLIIKILKTNITEVQAFIPYRTREFDICKILNKNRIFINFLRVVLKGDVGDNFPGV